MNAILKMLQIECIYSSEFTATQRTVWSLLCHHLLTTRIQFQFNEWNIQKRKDTNIFKNNKYISHIPSLALLTSTCEVDIEEREKDEPKSPPSIWFVSKNKWSNL